MVAVGLASCSSESVSDSEKQNETLNITKSIVQQCESEIGKYDLRINSKRKFTGDCSCLITEATKDLTPNETKFLEGTLVLFFKANKLNRPLSGAQITKFKQVENQLKEIKEEFFKLQKETSLNEEQVFDVTRKFDRAMMSCS